MDNYIYQNIFLNVLHMVTHSHNLHIIILIFLIKELIF